MENFPKIVREGYLSTFHKIKTRYIYKASPFSLQEWARCSIYIDCKINLLKRGRTVLYSWEWIICLKYIVLL